MSSFPLHASVLVLVLPCTPLPLPLSLFAIALAIGHGTLTQVIKPHSRNNNDSGTESFVMTQVAATATRAGTLAASSLGQGTMAASGIHPGIIASKTKRCNSTRLRCYLSPSPIMQGLHTGSHQVNKLRSQCNNHSNPPYSSSSISRQQDMVRVKQAMMTQVRRGLPCWICSPR